MEGPRRRRPAAARGGCWSPTLPYDEVVLVLEGAAKGGVPAGRDGHVRTVHARGSGDDEIVAQARAAAERGDRSSVVTADRMLQARVAASARTVAEPVLAARPALSPADPSVHRSRSNEGRRELWRAVVTGALDGSARAIVAQPAATRAMARATAPTTSARSPSCTGRPP